jgi:hypothetical protein
MRTMSQLYSLTLEKTVRYSRVAVGVPGSTLILYDLPHTRHQARTSLATEFADPQA